MDEIKVVPYIPDEDYDNPAMVVDFYEFTMANCLFLHGFKNTTLVFDMFFRKNPDNMGYSISAGQRKLTRFLLNYHFNEQDIRWLRTKGMSEEFCEYLRTYKWKGDMYALPEGTVCYPHVQMVRIECDLVGAILIETYLLQTMNFHSLIATKATFPMGPGPNDRGSSRRHLTLACEANLKRLGTDCIDVYFMHGFDALTPVEETLRTLDDLISAG